MALQSEFDFLLAKITYRENPNKEEDAADPIIIEQLDEPIEAATLSLEIVPVFKLEGGFPPLLQSEEIQTPVSKSKKILILTSEEISPLPRSTHIPNQEENIQIFHYTHWIAS